jgi:membrane associated rhomboid family serine protease
MKLSLTNKRKLTCPRCKGTLRAVDMGGIEIDACPNCNGSWFDQLEIEAFLRTSRNLSDYVPYALRTWWDSELTCPVCKGAMKTLRKNSVFPFDIDMCPVDKGYWFDGEELDQVAAIASKKTLRVGQVDTSVQDKMEQQIAQREVARIENRSINRYHPDEKAASFESVSFFELTGGQKLVAFLGLPVESGRFYEWRSLANLLIILANVAVFALMVAVSGSLFGLLGQFPKEWYMLYGLVPNRLSAAPVGASYTLLTSMFMHGGLLHLLGNMFFLFTTGDDVEKRLGHIPFLCFYLVAGIVADLVSVFTGNIPGIPHVGASGAIAGVMGAYLALCRHKSFYVWIFRIFVFGKMISVSAWLYLGFWFGIQLLCVKFGGNTHIDYWAHIGGFAFGFIVGTATKAMQSFNGLTGEWEWRRTRLQSPQV